MCSGRVWPSRGDECDCARNDDDSRDACDFLPMNGRREIQIRRSRDGLGSDDLDRMARSAMNLHNDCCIGCRNHLDDGE